MIENVSDRSKGAAWCKQPDEPEHFFNLDTLRTKIPPISSCDDIDDVTAPANSTPFGLAAYAWTGNHANVVFFFKGLHYGTLGVNTFMIKQAEAHFSGVEHSRMGHESGHQAIKSYRNTKLTHFDWN